jgi:hypothetical protein
MKKKQLSIDVPNKKDYQNHNEFGHYFAGLIDGDGHFSTIGHCVVAFHILDKQHAYWVKKRIGYGTVRKVPGKQAVILSISHPDGLRKVGSLIHDKLKHPTRILQYNQRVVIKYQCKDGPTSSDSIINWQSPWFAGFFDADGSFRIRFVDRPRRLTTEVRLHMRIDQKSDVLLQQFNIHFGGYLGYRAIQNTYTYSSTSFGQFWAGLRYFDEYSPKSSRTILKYLIMRKAYLLVQRDLHLTLTGLASLRELHKSLSSLNS